MGKFKLQYRCIEHHLLHIVYIYIYIYIYGIKYVTNAANTFGKKQLLINC